MFTYLPLFQKINEENAIKDSIAAAGPSTSTNNDQEEEDKEEDKDAKKKKNRCAVCRKKVGLTGKDEIKLHHVFPFVFGKLIGCI